METSGLETSGLNVHDVTETVRTFADFKEHECVLVASEPASGLHGVIAIHDRTLGPALGGCRMWTYATEAAALTDALRLSRKAALAGLPLGGGKAILIGDSKCDKTEPLFRAFGRFVEALQGRYITAEDVGTSVREMDWVAKETAHVTGSSQTGGNPSPMTALGVFLGMKIAARHRLGQETLQGRRVAVQGLGHVGYELCKLLHREGASLVVTDLDAAACARAAQELQADIAEPDEIYAVEADVFAPCALGAILRDETLPNLQCKIVAGSANNQLQTDRHGEALRKRGILYAPDYVINVGGLIYVAAEVLADSLGTDIEAAIHRALAALDEIFERAERENMATNRVADRIAGERLAKAKAASTAS
ncbi:MAG: Glu/Leu/Phe/Val dehydrogenase [Alphaproteobacteria bacterium]|nr:Glu/Leu/Phe/Val dehydrogenase [Alphaproteobacteria bacterium]